MNKYVKMVIQRGIFGIVTGLAIGYTMLMLLATFQEGFTIISSEVSYHYFLAMIVGFWMASSTVIYDVDEWSLLRQTVIHALVISPYIPIAFIIGWAPTTVGGGIAFVLGYIAIFAIIWLSFKAYWTKRAREMNLGLQRRKK